jgi:hypothetical protein
MDVLDPIQADENASTMVINTAPHPVSMPVLVRLAQLIEPSRPVDPSAPSDLSDHKASSESKKPASLDSLQIVSRQEVTEAFLELSGVPQFRNVEIIEAYAYADGIPAFGLAKLPGLSAAISAQSETAANLKENYTSALNNLAIHNQFLIAYIDKKGQLIVKEKRSGRRQRRTHPQARPQLR